ncbi:MAG TPA: hypothetical protein VG733_10175 [Chthoniobacteraceae bacterium]|nr:hypothetical protein [Chthoniobacteraceae bacterium]
MNTTFRLLLALFAFSAVCIVPLRGQDSSAAAKPSGAPSPTITAEQREKLKAAHQKAMLDPKVVDAQASAKSAWDDYRAIMRKKVIAADPSTEPLLDKVDKATEASLSGSSAPVTLTTADQAKLHDAFQKVNSDPDIKDALAKLQQAKKTKDLAVRAAIIAADPSLEPVLDAIDKAKSSGGQ